MKKKNLITWVVAPVLLAAVYPAFVLGFTWSHVLRSDLQGGKHGPLDAYRHTLASAVVSYTIGEPAVRLFTELVESRYKRSGMMDRHNNMIGASIGSECNSFGALEPAARQAVLNGSVDSKEPYRITWLPEEEWHEGRFW